MIVKDGGPIDKLYIWAKYIYFKSSKLSCEVCTSLPSYEELFFFLFRLNPLSFKNSRTE